MEEETSKKSSLERDSSCSILSIDCYPR